MLANNKDCERCNILGGYILKLEVRIKELEDRLNNDSNNSSMPPSSDFKKKKPQAKSKPASSLKPGGQPGHKGNYRKLEENPDSILRSVL